MENKLKFELFPDESFESRAALYQFLAAELAPDAEEAILEGLYAREELGSIQIAEQVVLPHVESSHISQSHIILIRLDQPIRWNDQLTGIQLIITIALKEDEERAVKQEISNFVKKLADEQIIAQLLDGNFENIL